MYSNVTALRRGEDNTPPICLNSAIEVPFTIISLLFYALCTLKTNHVPG